MLNLKSIRIEKYRCRPRFKGVMCTVLGLIYVVLYFTMGMYKDSDSLHNWIVDVIAFGLLPVIGLRLLFRRSMIEGEVRLGTWRDRLFRFNRQLFIAMEIVQPAVIMFIVFALVALFDKNATMMDYINEDGIRHLVYLYLIVGLVSIHESINFFQYYFHAEWVSPRVYRPRRWTLNKLIRYRFW